MSFEQSDVSGVIFFCHGSRDPRWRAPFDAIIDSFRSQFPEARAALAFLELMQPDVGSVIDELAREGKTRIQIVPLFLAPGAHTRRDLPALIAQARERWPDLQITAADTLTETPAMRDAIVEWAARSASAPPA